ncbi:hypothetical protein AUR64_05435 [Haloprofundus marisrubri]|uniref:DUF7344 domain-containing protein n=1 Tax=Haloprofundus marisrubri TaxID=1514971 RepID=A0A0W1RC72_9EURY|nr:hypothetical protein [Haloprofundus marisrubri]KTG11151.1 hypothetical protein AUR64_05435 [Haloprofundus marisrubri]
MSDDGFRDSGDGNTSESPVPDSITRNQTVTEGLDIVCSLLASPRRRYLLYYLLSLDDAVGELDAAVNAVQAYEAAGNRTDNPPPRESLKIDLHHNHLPRLAETRNCAYDRRRGTIRFTPHPTLEELVEHTRYKELN